MVATPGLDLLPADVAEAKLVALAEGARQASIATATGQAQRFQSVLQAYQAAKDVTLRRLYIETMERVFGDVNKVILDPALTGSQAGSGVVPFLPLDQLIRQPGGAAPAPAQAAPAAAASTGN